MNVARTACGCVALAGMAGFTLSHMTDPRGLAWLARVHAGESGHQAASTPLSADQGAGIVGVQPSPASSGAVLVVLPDIYGQYHADLEIEGRRVPALIDTGASWVSLSFEAAATLGFFPAPSDFKVAVNTANGVTLAAPVTIPQVRVGPLTVRQVKAIVQQRGALSGALLGMSFLRSLSGFSIESSKLVLRQ